MVEWKKLEDLGSYFGGLTGKTKDDFVEGNAKFITYMNVFANPSLDISSTGVVRINEGEKQNKIQKGDILFTGSSETPDEAGMSCVVTEELNEDYYMNSFCFGIRLDNPEQYCLSYLKHILRSSEIRKSISKSASGVTRFNISKARFGKISIPLPSLSEQNRIVGILDTFTSSIDNLKQQIAQRRKQYEHYRDQLLDLEGKKGVEMKILRSIVISYCTGATPNKGHSEYYEAGTIPWLRTQDVKFNEIYDIDTFVTDEAVEKTGVKWIPANCVIVAISGATAGRCAINKIPTTTNQHCLNLEINPKIALYKYVFYCVYNAYSDMVSRKQGARGDLNSSIILGITIPLPSLHDQQRIVSILDTFEASIQNLEAQLSQREKQYEYYRNKLLTFE